MSVSLIYKQMVVEAEEKKKNVILPQLIQQIIDT